MMQSVKDLLNRRDEEKTLIEKLQDEGPPSPIVVDYKLNVEGHPITAEDKLYIAIWNSASSPDIKLKGRMITKAGEIYLINREYAPTTDRIKNEYYIDDLPEGVIISLVVLPNFTTRRGQTFIHVSLLQGLKQKTQRHTILLQNYLEAEMALSYPGSKIISSTEGPGVPRLVTGSNPAVGAEVSESVPINARWKVKRVRNVLTTDDTVVNRTPRLLLDDGTSTIYERDTGATQPASETRQHDWVAGYPVVDTSYAGGIRVPLIEDAILFQGWRIRTFTSNMQAGDKYSAPLIYVEEWIEE